MRTVALWDWRLIRRRPLVIMGPMSASASSAATISANTAHARRTIHFPFRHSICNLIVLHGLPVPGNCNLSVWLKKFVHVTKFPRLCPRFWLIEYGMCLIFQEGAKNHNNSKMNGANEHTNQVLCCADIWLFTVSEFFAAPAAFVRHVDWVLQSCI